ncbi:hypothetical protein HUW62_01970 [Myxococcus sp. AM011]|uniref:hypothetical protein n=1 Tax=Myxococcus sp. AM011 TaxID=2745200 RepID=UPI001595C4A3|nr:hypothetical protein [Myxococcus sp. AM011]NVJ20005.1 hypothetical protein [Myxococcus sp. AM011]
MEAVIAKRVDEAMLDQVARTFRERRAQPGREQLLSSMPPAPVFGSGVQVQRHQLAARVSLLLEEVRLDGERLQAPGRHERVLQFTPISHGSVDYRCAGSTCASRTSAGGWALSAM